jgi:pyruvate formate lyase activating enzyme
MENENDEILGRIHSFETFGTVDGPGIRFVIFMQGCPLKCKYCQNRDTWPTHSGKRISTNDLVSLISRYEPYITSSNGGVTVTGGEPLLQASFLVDLFKKLKANGFHTAIDTSRYVCNKRYYKRTSFFNRFSSFRYKAY